MIDPQLQAEAQRVLETHARSFRLAQPFLPKDARQDAALVYAFCRAVDDIADEHGDARDLQRVQQELRGASPPRAIVAAYLDVAARRGIAPAAALDLVEGMLSDLDPRGVRVADDAALLHYCYQAAGTVGLMMAPLMGARHDAARAPAQALGDAMQLTNICRDVREDAERGRVYLPLSRLRAHGADHDDVLRGQKPAAVFAVVRELLALAETLYARADEGLVLLPPRARFTTLLAKHLYRGIGRAVLARGEAALTSRTSVSSWGRAKDFAAALLAFVPTLWARAPTALSTTADKQLTTSSS